MPLLMLFLIIALPFSAFAKVDTDCIKAYKLAQHEQFTKALNMIGPNKCPLLKQLIKWKELRYRGNNASFEEHYTFLTTHSDWPFLYQIRKNMERTPPDDFSPLKIKNWFQQNPPSTVEGATTYANALRQLANQEAAEKILRAFWTTMPLEKEEMENFLALHKKILNAQDYGARVNKLLWEGKADQAKTLLKYLNKFDQTLVKARIAFLKNDEKNIPKAFEALPVHLREEEGFLFERLKWHRRYDEENALAFYQKIRPAIRTHEEFWLKEKHIIVRDAIRSKKYGGAYALVSSHALKEGKFFAEAEWLAGFIAFRFLKDNVAAARHFGNLLDKVKKPTSISQAAYWGALAQEKLGNNKKRNEWLKRGASYSMTFYGQLCCEKLGMQGYLNLKPLPRISPAVRQKITTHKFAQIARLLQELEDESGSLPFLYILLARAHNMEERLVILEIAERGAPDNLIDLIEFLEDSHNFMYKIGYPLLKNIKWREGIDKVLVHALIRKESKFNPKATSWAGAIGMMQIMPNTAMDIAKKLKIKNFHPQDLYNKAKNLEFGQFYVNEIYSLFNKHKALFLAAYNAGHGNVNRKWLPSFGDPRTEEIDEITWMELVPFTETRFYIMKVSAYYKIYEKLIKK